MADAAAADVAAETAADVAAETAADVAAGGAAESAVACWLDVFSSLKSSRKPKGVRHPLASVLALVVVAVLSGCKNASQVHAFGRARPGLLPRLGFRRPKRVRKPQRRALGPSAPTEDTIGAVLASVPQREMNEKFALFLARMVGRGASRGAVDGKALRGAREHVLSVFVNEIGQVVWQERVGSKENELKTLERALPAVLERYPGLRLLTGDAGLAHKSVARALVRARRDYFLQLKSPHRTDVALARSALAQLSTQAPQARSGEKRGVRTGRKS
jgi:hypothetical protein